MGETCMLGRGFARWAVVFAMGALFAGACSCAPVAFADDGQTGTGETSLVVHLADTAEHGGINATGEFVNPDEDGDGLGDNLAFTVPIRLDFAAYANGDVICPSESVAYIKNESHFGVRVSSLDVDERSGWHIVEDASLASSENAIDLQIGPEANQLNASRYLDKSAVSQPGAWNMAAKAQSGTADRVQLKASGHINNVTAGISSEVAFGQINWYLTPGNAS